MLVTLLAVLIALPLGVATAVFVREVAPAWAREILKPLIEVLAGIPSVVLGFFGMTVVAPAGARSALGAPTGLTAFTGALVLAYMALPTIISVAEDALDAVPRELPRRRAGHGRDPLADDLARGGAGGPLGHPDRGDAGHGARHRRDHGRDDGDGQRRPHAPGRWTRSSSPCAP